MSTAPARQFDPLYWDDAYPIALALQQTYPQVDPIQVPLETLHQWVIALQEFADNANAVIIERLEEIQVEWIEIRD
jgi:FeS assembly protein IscX